MITDMPKNRPPHLEHFRSRHGRMMWFFRVGKGPRIRLPDDYGSPAFSAAYDAALIAYRSRPVPPGANTLGWLITQFEASPAWHQAAKETRKQMKYQFKSARH